jgi:hypothetical protein
MWSTQTLWFDVAVIMSIFAIGNIVFGHFEEHKPKLRRVAKVVIFNVVIVALAYAGLRWVAYTIVGALGVVALYVHGYWLPKNGVNGITGEPKDKYYELIGVRPRTAGDNQPR